ncbi:hypothetical protein BDV06DRAFT_194314 [Aspergillus oleicola]
MEAVGLVLAAIPLLVTALDKYLETLETMGLFRTGKYRRYLERYSNLIQIHQASIVNAIEIALGIEIKEEDLKGLLSQAESTGSIWKNGTLEARLRVNLGRNYGTFLNAAGEARHVMQDINRRLESVFIPSDRDQHRMMLGIRKAKNILSKREYSHLFDKLDTSINLLQRIVDQSIQCQSRTKVNRGSQCEVIRSPAASIHKALLQGGSWGCPCRDKHSVMLMVDPDFNTDKMSEVVFRVSVATVNDPVQSIYSWQDIEIEPSEELAGARQISHLCSTFTVFSAQGGDRIMAGTLSEGKYLHRVFMARRKIGAVELQSLEDKLISSTLAPWIPGFYFRKRDRLYLACRLAWSVLHLHGNWLREHWSSSDIIFPRDVAQAIPDQTPQHPCLSWNVSGCGVTRPGLSSAIPSQVLFPLALALTELSLCRPIAALQRPEDENLEESVSLLKTANRCIADVCSASGERYAMVVRRCLHWSETSSTDPDDEDFRASFYGLVVAPLLDIKKAFDGA